MSYRSKTEGCSGNAPCWWRNPKCECRVGGVTLSKSHSKKKTRTKFSKISNWIISQFRFKFHHWSYFWTNVFEHRCNSWHLIQLQYEQKWQQSRELKLNSQSWLKFELSVHFMSPKCSQNPLKARNSPKLQNLKETLSAPKTPLHPSTRLKTWRQLLGKVS